MEPADGPSFPTDADDAPVPPPPGTVPPPGRSFALFRGLKHKTIYRVVLGYAVGAWLILQVSAIVLPGLGLPGWVMRPVIVALLAGWMLDRRAGGGTPALQTGGPRRAG